MIHIKKYSGEFIISLCKWLIFMFCMYFLGIGLQSGINECNKIRTNIKMSNIKPEINNILIDPNKVQHNIKYQSSTRFNLTKPINLTKFTVTPIYKGESAYYQISRDKQKIALINTKALKYVNGYPLLRVTKPDALYTNNANVSLWKLLYKYPDMDNLLQKHAFISQSNNNINMITGFNGHKNSVYAIPYKFDNNMDINSLKTTYIMNTAGGTAPLYLFYYGPSNIPSAVLHDSQMGDLDKYPRKDKRLLINDALHYFIGNNYAYKQYGMHESALPEDYNMARYDKINGINTTGYGNAICYYNLDGAKTDINPVYNLNNVQNIDSHRIKYNSNQLHLEHTLVGVYDRNTAIPVHVDTVITSNKLPKVNKYSPTSIRSDRNPIKLVILNPITNFKIKLYKSRMEDNHWG